MCVRMRLAVAMLLALSLAGKLAAQSAAAEAVLPNKAVVASPITLLKSANAPELKTSNAEEDAKGSHEPTRAAEIAKPPQTDSSLPNALIIGDSISVGYTIPVRERLAGKFNVYHIPENSQGTVYSLKQIDRWLTDQKWDVIVFNWGSWDAVQIPPEVYEKNLRQLVERLKETKAKLIFATTIPAPETLRGFEGKITDLESTLSRYNAAARKVIADEHLLCVNIARTPIPSAGEFRSLTGDYHLTAAGYQKLGEQIAEAIEHPNDLVGEKGKPKLIYYMAVFSQQTGPQNVIWDSHTFATFVKCNGRRQVIENVTISWLSADHIVNPLNTRPQRGDNLTLHETLEWGVKNGVDVGMWGPFVIDEELYERAKERVAYLESGKAKYLILDRNWRKQQYAAFHCVHAVSDIGGRLDTQMKRGESASEAVVRHLAPWIIKDLGDYAWFIQGLNMSKYNIKHHEIRL